MGTLGTTAAWTVAGTCAGVSAVCVARSLLANTERGRRLCARLRRTRLLAYLAAKAEARHLDREWRSWRARFKFRELP